MCDWRASIFISTNYVKAMWPYKNIKIKTCIRQTSKNMKHSSSFEMIYSFSGNLITLYNELKQKILQVDYVISMKTAKNKKASIKTMKSF